MSSKEAVALYQIMLVVSKKEDHKSLYQFLTSTIDGVTKPVILTDKSALDAQVEYMLNNGYAKSDFIVVTPVDYALSADNYTDDD